MRLGAYPCGIEPGSIASRAYKKKKSLKDTDIDGNLI